MDQRPNIAIYVQHYLAPSMTFIYRQLKGIEQYYSPIVFCSDLKENLDRFPYGKIYHKQRNFIHFKKSRYYKKIFGNHTLLNTNPHLSLNQKRYFSRLIDENNLKLIHAHFGPSGLEIVDLAKQKELPLIVTFHGYDASVLLTMRKYADNIKKVFAYAHIITVSEVMKEELVKQGANSNNISVIRCGIPVESFTYTKRKPLSEKKKANELISFLQVSSFVEKKGHDYTVRAFHDFLEYYPNARLVLAGDGYLKTNIQILCERLGIPDKVKFLGNVDYRQIPELMESADVFLHHSVTSKTGDKEGIPTVIMEAMASGLPVISTFHSGIPELIDDGINGLLVSEYEVSKYSKKIRDILKDDGRLGQRARDKVDKDFNLIKQNKRLVDYYSHVVKASHKI